MTIRVGVIGCGKISQLMHLPFLDELPEFEIVHLCDISPGTVASVAARYGVERTSTDYADAVADPNVDAVLVATYDHGPVARAALTAGKHVLVEKPLAFTVEEAAEIVALAEASDRVAMIGYMKNYDDGFLRAREQIARIGLPKSVTVHDFAGRFDKAGNLYAWSRVDDVPTTALEAEASARQAAVAASLGPDHAGYADLFMKFVMLGSHDLAALRVLFGDPVDISYARQVGDGQVTAVLELQNGVPCILEVGIGARYEWWDQWIAVYGEKESARLEFSHPYVRYAPTVLRQWQEIGGAPCESVTPVSNDEPFRREWQHFARCIAGKEIVATPLRDGLRDLELARAIIQTIAPVTTAVLA